MFKVVLSIAVATIIAAAASSAQAEQPKPPPALTQQQKDFAIGAGSAHLPSYLTVIEEATKHTPTATQAQEDKHYEENYRDPGSEGHGHYPPPPDD